MSGGCDCLMGCVRAPIAIMGVCLVCLLAVAGCSCTREEGFGSKWTAGSTVDGGEHDIWVEFSIRDSRAIGVYRDRDRDGVVDEYHHVQAPTLTAVHLDTDGDGRLDTIRTVDGSIARSGSIAPDAPEAGPFTREMLDEECKRSPASE